MQRACILRYQQMFDLHSKLVQLLYTNANDNAGGISIKIWSILPTCTVSQQHSNPSTVCYIKIRQISTIATRAERVPLSLETHTHEHSIYGRLFNVVGSWPITAKLSRFNTIISLENDIFFNIRLHFNENFLIAQMLLIKFQFRQNANFWCDDIFLLFHQFLQKLCLFVAFKSHKTDMRWKMPHSCKNAFGDRL